MATWALRMCLLGLLVYCFLSGMIGGGFLGRERGVPHGVELRLQRRCLMWLNGRGFLLGIWGCRQALRVPIE